METFKNVVCPGCSCLCDDLEATVDDNGIEVVNACEMGARWFDRPLSKAINEVDGHSAELENAVAAAVQLLSESTAPLICGIEHLTTEAQQNAWKLADQLRATIDSTMTNGGRASQFALQRIGCVTSTLGEVASRSDLVVYWYCDPVTTHPRHTTRYSNPKNGTSRTLVVIDDQQTATASDADLFIQLPRTSSMAALTTIRGLLQEVEINPQVVLESTGIGIDDWQALVNRLKGARYGAFFYSSPISDSCFDEVTDSVAMLIRDLNEQTRFVSQAMRSDANAQSAENVLAWSSGLPFAVNLHYGFPRFNRLEYSTETILNRGECDLIMLCSARSAGDVLQLLPPPAVDHFQQTPKILITNSEPEEIANIRVRLTTGRPGKDMGGDYCRQDNVGLTLTNLCQQKHAPSAGGLLAQISNLLSR